MPPDDTFDSGTGGGASALPPPPDIGLSNAIPGNPAPVGPVSVQTPPPAAPGAQPRPSFFKGVIQSLGLALSQGAQAGFMAPRNSQGPSVAANIAEQMPQQRAQAATQAELDSLKIESAQVNLAILHHNLNNLQDDRIQAYYKAGQKFGNELVEKGNAEPVFTGKLADVQNMLIQKKQTNPEKNYMAFPNPAGQVGGPEEYMLLDINPKGFFDADMPDITVPASKAITPEGNVIEYPAFKIPGAKRGQRIDGYASYATTATKVRSIQDLDISRTAAISSKESTTEANITSRQSEGDKNRALRKYLGELGAQTKLTTAKIAAATKADDKEMLQALNERKTHIDKLATLKAKATGVSGALDIGGGIGRSVATEVRAIQDVDKRIAELAGKRTAGEAISGAVASGAVNPAKVPSGTKITAQIAHSYVVKAGGDKDKAKKLAAADGYDPASFVMKKQ